MVARSGEVEVGGKVEAVDRASEELSVSEHRRVVDADSRTRYVEEATRWLGEAGSGDLFKLVLRLDTTVLDHPVSDAAVTTVLEATRMHPEIFRDLPKLEGLARATLLRWAREVPAPERPSAAPQVDDVLSAMTELAIRFQDRNPELQDERDQMLRSYAERAEASGNASRALVLYRRLEPVDPRVEARCLAALGWWEEAADAFQRAGTQADELECVRQIPDFKRAAGLAASIDLGVANKMRWAMSLADSMGDESLDTGEPLTGPEYDALVDQVDDGLARARDSVPPMCLPTRRPSP